MVKKLEQVSGFERIIIICDCLNRMAEAKQFETVSTQEVRVECKKQGSAG